MKTSIAKPLNAVKLTAVQHEALRSIDAGGAVYAITMSDTFWKTVCRLIDAGLISIDTARYVRLTTTGRKALENKS